MIKADIMGWLEDEEEKMRALALQQQVDKAAVAQTRAQTPGEGFCLTVDDYYGIKQEDGRSTGRAGMLGILSDDKISFEKFVEKNAKANIFDNDLLEA